MEDPGLDLFGKGSVWVLECWIDLPGVNNCSFSRGMEHLGDPGVTLHSHGCCSCFLRVALEKKAGKPSRILGFFFVVLLFQSLVVEPTLEGLQTGSQNS